MPPTLERVDHVHVFVSDRMASEQWYAKVMGLRRVKELEFWAADGGPLTIANPSGTIHLALFERPADRCRSTIALAADAASFGEWRAHLSESLARPIDPVDHQLSWSLYFSDPDGNPFEITSYDYAALASKLTKQVGRSER
jgi:catechol-2,3-dioxygenase